MKEARLQSQSAALKRHNKPAEVAAPRLSAPAVPGNARAGLAFEIELGGLCGLLGIGLVYVFGVSINVYQLQFAVFGFAMMGAIMGFVVIIRGY
jgi:predicted lipid-binding transport protein (Tim44 family)